MNNYDPFSLFKINFPSGDVTQPWSWWYQLAPITINQMKTGDAQKELQIVQEVASYGRQLGRIIEVMDVMLEKVPLEKLTEMEQEAIDDFQEMSEKVRAVKEGYKPASEKSIDKMLAALAYWKENNPEFYREAKERLEEELKE